MGGAMRLLAPLLCAACAFALLTGCSSQATPRTEAGVVHFNLAADPTSLDPLFAVQDAASVDQEVARLCFEPFFDIDPNGRRIPELLREIPTRANGGISRDGQSITYRLRPGVRWQDGVAVTSRDVVFTLHAIMDPRNPVRSRAGYGLIDSATALDARTVVFHLRHRWAPAVETLFSYGSVPEYVLPAHVLAPLGPLLHAPFSASPVCDGPYVLQSWRRGDRLTYIANEHYWRGAPRIKQLVVRIVPDPGTNFTMLQAGASDWNLIAPAQQPALAGVSGLRYAFAPLALVAGVAINLTHAPLDDIRVRRALAAAIDRATISKKITLGRYPVTDSDQPQLSWAYDPHAKLPAYDPAAASRLLEKAGWHRGSDGIRSRDGKPLTLTYVQFPESTTGVRAATAIQLDLRAVGVDVQIKSVSNAQLFLPKSEGGLLAAGDFDLAYVPWPMGADPDDSVMLTCNGPSNYMRYCNRRVDALERDALSTYDQVARKRDYERIQEIVAHDVPVIYLFNPTYVYAYRDRLRNFAPSGFSPTWNAWRWEAR
ncbi:peptide ABC transporter substrate-binding protein [bacterium]|nr:MAG: peptide ABC transporter substrate-binding protein [bacterium]